MKVALIYPPTCDPTAPYISVPILTACLRREGIETHPVDANVEAYDRLLRKPSLDKALLRVKKRLSRLERKKSLDHQDQLLYSRLRGVEHIVGWVPESIDDAVSTLRDKTGERFFDPEEYEKAVVTVESALEIVGAAYSPLVMDFTGYRTPFSLLTPETIRQDALPENNPFHEYFSGDLCDELIRLGAGLVGVSMAFPGQIQPGFTMAYEIARRLPGAHVAAGGPALTQMLLRLDEEKIPRVLGPFHSAVLFEGERALVSMVRDLESGKTPPRVIRAPGPVDLSDIPSPDFEGMPLEKYFSPELVLPYDPTRGCYWGKCAFCQYGLSGRGTAGYRTRPAKRVVTHLEELKKRWSCRIFYFSQDAFAPRTALRVGEELRENDVRIRWASDMRPEPALTEERCRELFRAGALAVSLGIESAHPRVLSMIDKGVGVEDMRAAVENLSAAGIAVEAMCFTDFPGETADEAFVTLEFVERMRKHVALFICGRFGLCHGSRVAGHPEEYGIEEIWGLEGDELESGLFYRERENSKSEEQREALDRKIDLLSEKWRLRDYPWAGALSTAHTLLWYERLGPDVFKRLSEMDLRVSFPGKTVFPPGRYDAARIVERAFENEDRIWRRLIHDLRAVSPMRYRKLARALPHAFPVVKKRGKRVARARGKRKFEV